MKRIPRQYYLLAICLLIHSHLTAQSDFDFTQRWFNESIYNPAAVGNSKTSGVFSHTRAQWVGTDGAPITQALTFDTYVENINSGIGIVAIHDRIGYLNSNSVKLSYAYYIKLNDRSNLSLGLSAGLLNRNRKITNDITGMVYDPALVGKNTSDYAPEFETGLEYKGALKFGVSVRHLGVYDETDWTKPGLNIWSYISSRFNLLNNLSIEPCAAYMYRDRISYYEAGFLFYFMKSKDYRTYNDQFWIGGIYRTLGQFSLLAGLHITPKIRLGYSFDYGVGDLSAIANLATHEIFLAWQFDRIFYKDDCCPAYSAPSRVKKRWVSW